MDTLTDEQSAATQSDQSRDEQKKQIAQRVRIHQLHFQNGLSRTEIARGEGISKATVMRWTKSKEQDLSHDARGWPSGRSRHIDEAIEQRVVILHAKLVADPKEFFAGATAIELAYRRRYPRSLVPSLRTIGRILKKHELSGKRTKGRNKGAAAVLHYPEQSIHTLFGERVLELDFIGPKYLTGSSQPLYFLGFSFKKAPKLRYYVRVEDTSADTLIDSLGWFLDNFEPVDAVKFDNCAATIGSISAKRTVSRLIAFLLKREITPIFAVPRKPFSQASIEGNNSVFARKFWNVVTFTSVAHIDRQLVWFNRSSMRYSGYEVTEPKKKKSKTFVPRIIFLRQVCEDEKGASITVLNERIAMPKNRIKHFVLAEWNLMTQQLTVSIEIDNALHEINSCEFAINPSSKYRP